MEETKPWYASRTIWAALVTVGSTFFMLTGKTLAPELTGALPDALAMIGAAVGSLVTIWGRMTAEKKIGSGG